MRPLRGVLVVRHARTSIIMSLRVAPAWEAVSDTGHNVRFTPESGHSEGSRGMSAYDPKRTWDADNLTPHLQQRI